MQLKNSATMFNVLWIAPNLNHYKARFLNRLAKNKHMHLTVLSGAEMRNLGHRPNADKENNSFVIKYVNANKNKIHTRPYVYIKLLRLLSDNRFKVVLMPLEKKHILLILYLFILKFILRYKLVSYNHPIAASKKESHVVPKYNLSRLLFSLYDKIIFYTEQGKTWALENKLLPPTKAYFANNTLDTKQIWRNYSFEINRSEPKTILFIGRLMPNKRIDLLFEYFDCLKRKIPDLQLIVIGDGPMSMMVKKSSEANKSIHWRGAVIDEEQIVKDMRRSHVIFVPGHSGLSIVHAFCYGKPYITLSSYKNHPPEIDYLEDEVNGLLLRDSLQDDCDRIAELLLDETQYSQTCEAAYASAQRLSVENWSRQMEQALSFDET